MKLKEVLLSVMLFAISTVSINAQTNTFPSTGNAGIGTTQPGGKLEVYNGNVIISNDADPATLVLYGDRGNSGDQGTVDNRISFQTDNNPNEGWNIDNLNYTKAGQMQFIYRNAADGISTNALTLGDGTTAGQGYVGIGTKTPGSLLEIKKGIDMGPNGTQYVAPYYIGTCNDFAAGAAEQYLILTPCIDVASGSPSAGLNGRISFYRGHATAYNLAFDYDVNIQTAYSSTFADIKPLTSTSQLVNIYKLNYSGIPYLALKVKEVAGTSASINFRGYFWNNINAQKPQLIPASSASNISIFKAYEPILGKLIYGNTNGNILIGKTSQANTDYRLDVAGYVRADKVVVNTNGADFVFDSAYNLMPLDEVESFIKTNHHLPQIAPASDMQANGLDLGDNQTKLLQKIEELTLYLIEQNKQLVTQNQQIQQLTTDNNELKQQLSQIDALKIVIARQQEAIEQLQSNR